MHSYMKRFLGLPLAVLLLCGMTAAVGAEDFVSEAIQLYRSGKFADAEGRFAQLHASQPEDSRITYYLAMTEAQLGRFEQARTHYNEVVLLDPNSQLGGLAAQGLKYLPASGGAFDPPPRFQAASGTEASGLTPGNINGTGTALGAMSPQDMMAMQMMMSQRGGGNQNNGMGGLGGLMAMPGMNGMMPGMTGSADPSNPNANNPYAQMDPSVMGTMMMNQMMQNFNFTGGDDDQNR